VRDDGRAVSGYLVAAGEIKRPAGDCCSALSTCIENVAEKSSIIESSRKQHEASRKASAAHIKTKNQLGEINAASGGKLAAWRQSVAMGLVWHVARAQSTRGGGSKIAAKINGG